MEEVFKPIIDIFNLNKNLWEGEKARYQRVRFCWYEFIGFATFSAVGKHFQSNKDNAADRRPRYIVNCRSSTVLQLILLYSHTWQFIQINSLVSLSFPAIRLQVVHEGRIRI